MDLEDRMMFRFAPMWLIGLIALFRRSWGSIFGAVRGAVRKANVAAAQQAALRAPGTLYCPECGCTLEAKDEGGVPVSMCLGCEGKWTKQAALGQAAERRRRALEWFHDAETTAASPLACPSCVKPMETGGFSRLPFTVSRCQPCGGYWFNRIDWVSCRLEF